MDIVHAQVAQKTKGSVQYIALEAALDLATSAMRLAWYNVSPSGVRGRRVIRFGHHSL